MSMSHRITAGLGAIALAVLIFAIGTATNASAATAPSLGTAGSYGVIAGSKVADRLHRIDALVEKPALGTAPTNLAIVPGRYVLPPEIFPILEQTEPGKGGEIQLTDCLQTLARQMPLYGYEFEGDRYDAGNKLGFVEATVAFALKRPDLGPKLRPILRRLLDG